MGTIQNMTKSLILHALMLVITVSCQQGSGPSGDKAKVQGEDFNNVSSQFANTQSGSGDGYTQVTILEGVGTASHDVNGGDGSEEGVDNLSGDFSGATKSTDGDLELMVPDQVVLQSSWVARRLSDGAVITRSIYQTGAKQKHVLLLPAVEDRTSVVPVANDLFYLERQITIKDDDADITLVIGVLAFNHQGSVSGLPTMVLRNGYLKDNVAINIPPVVLLPSPELIAGQDMRLLKSKVPLAGVYETMPPVGSQMPAYLPVVSQSNSLTYDDDLVAQQKWIAFLANEQGETLQPYVPFSNEIAGDAQMNILNEKSLENAATHFDADIYIVPCGEQAELVVASGELSSKDHWDLMTDVALSCLPASEIKNGSGDAPATGQGPGIGGLGSGGLGFGT